MRLPSRKKITEDELQNPDYYEKSLLIMAMMFTFAFQQHFACTNFLVGKDASADGSTFISYAADSYGMFGFLHFVPAARSSRRRHA